MKNKYDKIRMLCKHRALLFTIGIIDTEESRRTADEN